MKLKKMFKITFIDVRQVVSIGVPPSLGVGQVLEAVVRAETWGIGEGNLVNMSWKHLERTRNKYKKNKDLPFLGF